MHTNIVILWHIFRTFKYEHPNTFRTNSYKFLVHLFSLLLSFTLSLLTQCQMYLKVPKNKYDKKKTAQNR